MDRLGMLEQMVAQRPTDPFPRYGLAMELRGQGRVADALEAFRVLVAAHPSYVAAYLMYGNTLAQAGEVDQARAIYRTGIEAASRAGDGHSRGELAGALAALEQGE